MFLSHKVLVQLLLAAAVTGAAAAQAQPGDQSPSRPEQNADSTRPWGGRGHRMMSGRVLQGPVAPAILRDSVGLSGDRLERYDREYTNYMKQTAPARDSLRTAAQAMRDAFERGDRSQARSRRVAIREQARALASKDREFEKVLRQNLTADQQKKYDQWKETHRKAAREHRHKLGDAAGR